MSDTANKIGEFPPYNPFPRWNTGLTASICEICGDGLLVIQNVMGSIRTLPCEKCIRISKEKMEDICESI